MKKSISISLFALCVLTAKAQTEVYNEDFQAGIPAGYTLINNDGLTPHASVSEFSDAWISLADPDNSADTIAGSTSYFDPAGTADRWLITPGITLGAFGNILYWEAKSHDASFPDGYQVLLSTTDTQISSFDTLHTVIIEIDTWNQRSLNLSELGYDNQTVYIAFANKTNDGFKLYVDDIRVEIEDPVGLTEIGDINLHIYPNPFNEVIRIESEDFISASVFQITGEEALVSKSTLINTSSLQAGNYLVKITTEKGIFFRKLSKI